MRILYQNVLKAATLTADDEAPSFPVENLVNNTSLLDFRSTTNTAEVSGEWDTDQVISAFALANHSLTAMVLTLKNAGGSTLFTETYTGAELRFNTEDSRKMIYLDASYSGVREIILEMTSISTLSLGLFWCGTYLQTPPFSAGMRDEFKSGANTKPTLWGVNWEQDAPVLESFSVSFNYIQESDFNALNSFFKIVGKSAAVWVDRWEESQDVFPAVYAKLEADIKYKKEDNGVVFSGLSLKFGEIR